MPPVAPFPRSGFFPIAPTGPGYYSLCDELEGNCRKGPPKYPYNRFTLQPPSFFDMDWRYLDDPKNTEHDIFDGLKRIRFGPDDMFMFSTGGEIRYRYNFEDNSRLLNAGAFRGRDNSYDLFRLRVYGDLWITENVRVYGEFLHANTPNHLLVPLIVDRNPADLLNMFVDIRTLEVMDKPVWLRVGRQELLYGSQRLLSTIDWINTRRTFQGIKGFWQSKELNVDAFVVNPVVPPGTYAGASRDGWTSPDTQQTFAGLWTTYKVKPGTNVDLYYLLLHNDRDLFRASGGIPGRLEINTFGTRFAGDQNNFLWDGELMAQIGRFGDQQQSAWAATLGGGYYFKDVAMTPTVWACYDYASGSRNVAGAAAGAGPIAPHTFNQLFPFGHYYFGWLDLVGRQNIHDVSFVSTVYPAKWLFAQFQLHNFWLDSSRDALYNAGGAATRRDPTGNAGNYVGTELDFIFNVHLSNHADVLLGYSYLFAGDFIRNTATTAAGREDPQAVYVQFSYRW